jgi:hypothetical protein
MTADEFLRRCTSGDFRIVNSGDLTRFQIAAAQAEGLFYVDPETSYGWALLPWGLTTDQDRKRESTVRTVEVSEALQEKLQKLMYYLTKEAARTSYREFLEFLDISESEYETIKQIWKDRLGVKPYV